MLTALLIQARADVHTNTHTNAQRCGARARQNSNIFVFPSRTLAAEREKKNQKDFRLEKRGFCRGKRKTREDKWTESSRGEARNWKDSKLYISVSGNYWHTPETPKMLSHFAPLSNTRHKKYIQPWMCILAYCNRTLCSLRARHFQGKGVRTSEIFSPVLTWTVEFSIGIYLRTYSLFQTGTWEDFPTLWVVCTTITGYRECHVILNSA